MPHKQHIEILLQQAVSEEKTKHAAVITYETKYERYRIIFGNDDNNEYR